ncbi:MAG TPA: tryptophan 7-halogenase [Thermoanaerobaculia bacterium]|jgi:flavin-dependent dehydrogenase|nr:tryptophan 7-halogenase [Thermoanaerobaculia bacterium]
MVRGEDLIDVVIVGGGPAGSAAGLSLRSHAPGLSVVQIEASAYAVPRIGETLPPQSRRLLEHLGVWETFRNQGHEPVAGTAAVWGAPLVQENDFLFTRHGDGWHLDRTAFDAMLAGEAGRRGVQRVEGRVIDAAREQGGWRLSLSNGPGFRARFLIDATGSSATLARKFGARFVATDRLTGFVRFFEDRNGNDPRSLVEAFEDGWWYTAGLPGGKRIAACMTDADLARRLRLSDPESWSRRLDDAEQVRARLQEARPQGDVVVRAAHSRRLDRAAGEGWLAVGDAASVFDPLSSSGITKALRSGIFASYAIGDLLVKGDGRSLERYRRYSQDEFESYTRVRARYYSEERRWPESDFWRRRAS